MQSAVRARRAPFVYTAGMIGRTLWLAAVALIGGCAGADAGSAGDGVPEASAALIPLDAEPPADFTLALSVFSPQGVRTANLPPEGRAARYILEPDWSLRAAVGPQLPATLWRRRGGGERVLPGVVRQLTAAQVGRVWQRLGESGLTSAPPTDPSPGTLSPPTDRLTYVIAFAAGGRRSWAVIDGASGAGGPLVRELALLAFQYEAP